MKILTLIFSLCSTINILASPVPDFPFIAISGESSLEVKPNIATITFSVLSHNQDAEIAMKNINVTLNSLTKAILSKGVLAKDITANDVEKEVVREKNDNRQKLKIIGYNVSRDVKIRVKELKNYTDIIRQVISSSNVTSVKSNFDTTERDEIKLKLIAQACTKAKKKAEILSQGAGVQLGNVFSVSDSDFNSLSSRFGFGNSGNSYAFGLLPSIGSDSSDDIPIFIPAKVKVYASVSILYRLSEQQ